MKKRRYFLIGFICLITSSQILVAQELYQQYEPETTTRVREAIEWSITYTYNSQDTELPRVFPLHHKMRPLPTTASQEKSHVPY